MGSCDVAASRRRRRGGRTSYWTGRLRRRRRLGRVRRRGQRNVALARTAPVSTVDTAADTARDSLALSPPPSRTCLPRFRERDTHRERERLRHFPPTPGIGCFGTFLRRRRYREVEYCDERVCLRVYVLPGTTRPNTSKFSRHTTPLVVTRNSRAVMHSPFH